MYQSQLSINIYQQVNFNQEGIEMFNKSSDQISTVRIKKGNFVYYRTMQGKLANRLNIDLTCFSLAELEVILKDLLQEMDLKVSLSIYKGDNHIRVSSQNASEDYLLIGDRPLIIDGEPVTE